MKEEFENRIIQHLADLAKNTTNLVQLLIALVSKRVLMETEYENIECLPTDYNRNTKLYFTLMKKDDNAFDILLDCLVNTGNERLAILLGKDILKTGKDEATMVWFDIHSPTKFYVGREKEIGMINKYWEECLLGKRLTFVAISGLGGVGKSEIAKEYAKRFYNEVGGSCTWINAETIFSQLESFRKLAEKLEISITDTKGNEKGLQSLVMEIYGKLGGTKWLVILDNMELSRDGLTSQQSSKESILGHFVSSSIKPPSEIKPFVLITTRYRPSNTIFGNKAEHIPLEVLTEEASVEFISKSLQVDVNNADTYTQIKSICKGLEYFPLALHQAVGFIEEQQEHSPIEFAVQTYTGLIDGEAIRLLNRPLNDHNGISQTTYLTWKVTLNKIQKIPRVGPMAIAILNIISFLSPDNISSKLLNKITDNLATKEVLQILHDYSMCKLLRLESETLIFIHRLVQEVIRLDLQEQNKLVDTLDNLLGIAEKKLRARELSLDEMSHVTSIWEHTRKHTQLIEKYQQFPDAISMKFYSSGRYGEAFEFSRNALQIMESALGENNQWAIWMLGWQAVIFQERGQYEESYNLMTQVYEKQKSFLGEEHDHTLYSANSIGLTLSGLKNYKQAMDWFQYALEKRIKLFGKVHQGTLTLQNNIANVLDEEGRYEEALVMYQEVVDVRERQLGNGHPSTLNAKHNIGCIKYRQKKYYDALRIFREILQLRNLVQEVDHPDILKTKYWIGEALRGVGRHEEASEISKDVFEKTAKIFESMKMS